MERLQVNLLSILGFTICLALLIVACNAQPRWHRIVTSLAAGLGMLLQGVIWGHVTLLLKALNVGGSYLWLYAALLTSVAGTVWALVLLGTSLLSRRSTG
jgi:hypothetical protein